MRRTSVASSAPTTETETTLSAPRVLVVDDDASIRGLLEVTFMTEGLDVTTARNGQEAVEYALTEEPFDCIFLDVMMPVMDGWAAAELLKSEERTKDVPIVFLTARTQEDWFDASGFLLLMDDTRDGEVVGFHWTRDDHMPGG